MSTTTWIILVAIGIAVILAIIFRKHLKKIGIGIGFVLLGWIGIETASEIPATDDEIVTPVDSIPDPTDDIIDYPEVPDDSIDEPEEPKPDDPEPEEPEPTDTIGEIYKIKLSDNPNIDQTVSLQEQIDAIPDGTPENWNVIQLPEGRFWTEGDLANNYRGEKGIVRIENRHYIIIRGPSTLYTRAPAIPYGGSVSGNNYSKRRHFNITNSSNVILQKIRVEGSNVIDGSLIGSPGYTPDFWGGTSEFGGRLKGAPPYVPYWEMEHAFQAIYSSYITFEECEVYGVWGDGYYTAHSNNISFINTYSEMVSRQGIGVSNQSSNILIDNAVVLKGARAAVDLEPSGSSVIDGVEIRNCDFRRGHFAAGGRGIINNVNFHHNIISGGLLLKGREVNPRKNWKINHNTYDGVFGSPMPFLIIANTDNIEIKGNKFPVSPTQGREAIVLLNCGGDLKIIDNDFQNPSIIKVNETSSDANITIEGNNPPAENGVIELNSNYAKKRGMSVEQPQKMITFKKAS